MNSINPIFNKIVDCAYGEAICMDISGYYSSILMEKLEELCSILDDKFPFATFSSEFIDWTCEFGIKVEAIQELTPKRLDSICSMLPQMKLINFDKTEALFYFDDEKYFENNFINNNNHRISGKKLAEKYGMELIE